MILGEELTKYAFPAGHPMSSSRVQPFLKRAEKIARIRGIRIYRPKHARDSEILLFHSSKYVDRVKLASETGMGYLDYGDTPAFIGVYEASTIPVGSTLSLLEAIDKNEIEHGFNPVGGLHHAMPSSASGFCVFNDAGIAIKMAHEKMSCKRILYVDIDAHHGDGIYYTFEEEPWLYIADIHEDGRYLFPGTGYRDEDGKGEAKGTKLNIPLPPGSDDKDFIKAFDEAFEFCKRSEAEIIFFQAGADGLKGDPLTHLRYSEEAHRYAARKLHLLAHEMCNGRLLVMGGGGYNADNVDRAWTAILEEIS
jgi:acetoin utilization protein AcuC